jgi:hypothetical protein
MKRVLIGVGTSVVVIAAVLTGWLRIKSAATTKTDHSPPYLQSRDRYKFELKLLTDTQKRYGNASSASELKAAERRYADYTENSHIHAAYGIYDCAQPNGKQWLTPINGENDPDVNGIHAHADGLLHVHPFVAEVTGNRAVLSRWFEATGVRVSDTEIFLPAKDVSISEPNVPATEDRTLTAGFACADGKPSVIRTFVYENVVSNGKINRDVIGKAVSGDPAGVRIRAGFAYAFARVHDGFTPEVPPSAEAMVAPSDQVSK